MVTKTATQEFLGPELALKWVTLSERVQVARQTKRPSDENGFLLETAKNESTSPLSPLLQIWAADNLKLENRYREAIELYDQVPATASGEALSGIDMIAETFESKGILLSRLQLWDSAVEALARLEQRAGRENWARMQLAKVLEAAGRIDEAAAAYGRILPAAAAETASHEEQELSELAARNALFLQDTRGVFRASPKELTRLLLAALQANAFSELQELASQTHFSVGVAGGHPEFVDREEVLGYLREDLRRSAKYLTGDNLAGVGKKRYLLTKGWRGKWFSGLVSFYLVDTSRGWQWRGLVLHTPTRRWRKLWVPPTLETNQPLEMTIGCPWPDGTAFMAGGLKPFLLQLVGISVLAALWPVGTLLAAAATYALSLRRCGFGTRGFYYNHGPTHRGQNAFAIDFTKYQTGAPFWNISGGTSVLAVAWGQVTRVVDSAVSGDPDTANRVEIRHIRGESATGMWDPATGTSTTGPTMTFFEPYESRYLHMSGPFAIPVSMGMSVRKGARLGTMNDTGNSVVDHLHFSLHDTRTPTGMSVRPSPMDGHSLLDANDGSCIRSFTRPFP